MNFGTAKVKTNASVTIDFYLWVYMTHDPKFGHTDPKFCGEFESQHRFGFWARNGEAKSSDVSGSEGYKSPFRGGRPKLRRFFFIFRIHVALSSRISDQQYGQKRENGFAIEHVKMRRMKTHTRTHTHTHIHHTSSTRPPVLIHTLASWKLSEWYTTQLNSA